MLQFFKRKKEKKRLEWGLEGKRRRRRRRRGEKEKEKLTPSSLFVVWIIVSFLSFSALLKVCSTIAHLNSYLKMFKHQRGESEGNKGLV